MKTGPDRDSYYDQEQARERLVLALESQRRRRRTGEFPRPISAARLAQLAGIRPGGNRESRRRGVRLAVEKLKKEGVPIAAGPAGYYIAETPEDHAAYRNFLHRHAIAELLTERAARRRSAAQEATGQLVMFA